METSKKLRVREPFSAFSHLVGALLSCVALAALVIWSHGDRLKITSFAIYGTSMIVLYIASSIYHTMHVSPVALERLRRFDQCAIFLLIAGSFTPVCVKLHDPLGWTILSIVWTIALAGIAIQVAWSKMPCWLSVVLYFVISSVSVVGIGPIAHVIGMRCVMWLFAGGIIYTSGAVVFATERPRLWPGVFGFHDLWHVFVLAATAAHFMMMTTLL